MALAFVLSCLLTFLPSLVGMAVVKHAGVNLSGPQGVPLNDDPLYYRWDEGLPGSVVHAFRSLREELERRSTMRPDWEFGRSSSDLVIWEIDVEQTS